VLVTESASTPAPLVAQVLLDVSLPHLDRTFDYAVPEALDAAAVPGARVRVRFAGRKVNGFIVKRTNSTEHTGKLATLDAVVSSEPILTPAIADVARRVADHYAGTVADVLRLAIPPRHAKVEAEDVAPFVASESAKPEDVNQWQHLTDGEQFLGELSQGLPSRAVIAAPPSLSIAELVAQAIVRTRNGAMHDDGRSVLVVVPDHRDVDHFAHVLETALPADCVTRLTADLGPAKRYRHWLSILRGQSRVVVGTRAAMFAPVCEPGLFIIVDDGDDLHAEQHAPYPHVREVLAMRSMGESAGLLVIGRVQTCEGERLVRSGWARSISADREFVRSLSPRVHTVGSDAELERDPGAVSARLPSVALRTARTALESGPVLVQVPRAGYLPVVACQNCREVAHCDNCHGPLRLTGAGRAPMCGWCGTVRAQHVCAACGSSALRAVRTGAGRTAEELGRAFPGIQVITSGREGVVSRVSAKPALVVSTPGAEPIAEGGYSAALLLDGDSLLHRVDLRSDEEALRRWMNAASLVKPTGDVVIMADPAHASVQAVVRWDPLGFAHTEYQQRTVAHLPPTSRVAALDGPPRGIDQLMGELELPDVAEVLGPVPLDEPERVRLIIRVPLAQGAALAKELHRVQSVRSARKVADHVVVRIDPLNLI
jgi:primosomal protein N' (replication factor Y)